MRSPRSALAVRSDERVVHQTALASRFAPIREPRSFPRTPFTNSDR